MRKVIYLVAATAAFWAVEPARSQTYDPRYPVCVQTFGPFGAISCNFTSMGQCRMAVSPAQSAQCIVNPFFGGYAAAPPQMRPRARSVRRNRRARR